MLTRNRKSSSLSNNRKRRVNPIINSYQQKKKNKNVATVGGSTKKGKKTKNVRFNASNNGTSEKPVEPKKRAIMLASASEVAEMFNDEPV